MQKFIFLNAKSPCIGQPLAPSVSATASLSTNSISFHANISTKAVQNSTKQNETVQKTVHNSTKPVQKQLKQYKTVQNSTKNRINGTEQC